ncbi:hypothetical protein [Gordonia sp. SL306]|uniref:hypothetical protein n=1 Tax=Gordonia sp. SL306 TaxID=2995145 RepID=UPI002271E863|nr:hypothetical protein [Gordonia sp. SL306]WAC55711.1 hypothetical protein OVA31_24645 [Gordonia sp. SL306]
MTEPGEPGRDEQPTGTSSAGSASTGPVPGPRPGPHLMPRSTGGQTASESADGEPPEAVDPDTVTDTVAQLLVEVDSVRQAAGDAFDLPALARQTELLERAHDALTTALEDVDPR